MNNLLDKSNAIKPISKSEYLKILRKTQGAWAGDDWDKTEKRQRKIELKAAKQRKNNSSKVFINLSSHIGSSSHV